MLPFPLTDSYAWPASSASGSMASCRRLLLLPALPKAQDALSGRDRQVMILVAKLGGIEGCGLVRRNPGRDDRRDHRPIKADCPAQHQDAELAGVVDQMIDQVDWNAA